MLYKGTENIDEGIGIYWDAGKKGKERGVN